MQKLAKRLSVFMAAIMTLSMMLNFVMVAPAKAATVYPQVQYATEPQLEYEVGDIVNFDLHTPNYGGRVQYRVVLWNDETKSYKDLWTDTPDRYYTNWMPYGNNIFNLHWKIDVAGHYRITIYAKRAGIPNNECYLKGFNCDSYMESDSFVVKEKEVAAAPDVAAESLTITAKSVQQIVGQEYVVTADVKKAGVKVIFLIDAPADSLNKDMVGEAVSDSNGVATYKYTRTYADAEYVTAFSAAAPTVRDAQKVFWGVKPILTIAGMDEADAASVLNGGVKQYKVKLTNPLTGEPMKYKEIKVMLKENIDTVTADVKSTATVTNDFNGTRVTPYQRVNNIVPGGLNEVTLSLVTNDNGEATFTLTGYNTKATPVVFYDSYQFFNELQAIQLFQFEYINQLPAPITLPDTSQYAPTFAGDYDNRLDATELQAEAKTVSFDITQYTFESSMDGTKYVAVDGDFETGRTYTVTVKKPDGKAFAGGKVMVRLEELFDNNLNNDCDARIVEIYDEDDDGIDDIILSKSLQLSLNSAGRAQFMVASDELNDIVTPRVWVDQDTRDFNLGTRDGLYTNTEPTKVLDTIYFVNEAIEAGGMSVSRADSNLEIDDDADGNLINLGGNITNYRFTIYDQNGSKWIPDGSEVLVTYTLTNEGSKDITVYRPDLDDVKVGRKAMGSTYTLKPDETITISGIDDNADSMIKAATASKTAGKLSVKVHAVVTKSHDQEWFWSQPTNTIGALVADGTATSTWVAWSTYASYTKNDVPLKGKVVALDKANKFFVFNPDNATSKWIMVEHYNRYPFNEDEIIASAYLLTYPADRDAWHISDYDEFDRMITLGDSVYYVYDTNIDDYVFDGEDICVFEFEGGEREFGEDVEVFDVALYRLYNADNSNDRPEIDDYALEVTDPDQSVWTLSNDFDYVAFDEDVTVTYEVLDQFGDLIGIDEDYEVVIELDGDEYDDGIISEDDETINFTIDIDDLAFGDNKVQVYLVDEDGDKISGTTRTIEIFKVDEVVDSSFNDIVKGDVVGFDEAGRLIVKTGSDILLVDVEATEYDGITMNGRTVNPGKFIDNIAIGDFVEIDLGWLTIEVK